MARVLAPGEESPVWPQNLGNGRLADGPLRDEMDALNIVSANRREWQRPLPPVRFPLREALLSGYDIAGGAGWEDPLPDFRVDPQVQALNRAMGKGSTGKVRETEKSIALAEIGRLRRMGLLTSGLLEEPPQPRPKPPPEADRARTPPKAMASSCTLSRQARRKQLEQEGAQWPMIQESASAPSLGQRPPSEEGSYRETWTSAARAVISHSKRFPGDMSEEDDEFAPKWAGASLLSYRHLPRPVKSWATKGFEFTDRGLGVGNRAMEDEVKMMGRRSPTFVYEAQKYGSIAMWSLDSTSKPSMQPSSKHVSSETHRLGMRRLEKSVDTRQLPGPGSYEISGFVDELKKKIPKKIKGKRGVGPLGKTR
mmetsp:Transcript_15965/g.34558  ORF Transcript_15965/g.34558 Transcript_15965/m.34558 type:complete len:367 (+) Transcript_15965:102-1202(+)|eukprot:CAMPEP_0206436698 /NCGR_PEP_ID=MMETSP0324_2-20121206/10631_1 /ASSEMBLY_ACC=CAM_ASM_000836 /TAXON_ID=2866 /ORGANISM="Crypthecodinium cohnii, Strain Seligo" /LENGTH=366 /DNA_ID=CAMNT_0053903899 /DNA_START=93 /DNA_END=1193 /DNA_ORIENTATION=+